MEYLFMALTVEQQLLELFNRSKHILITFSPARGGDALGSSLALANFLEHQGKQVDIVVSNWQLPGVYRFLPNTKKIKTALASLSKFIISLDLSTNKLEDLSYSVDNNRLHIYLTPKSGTFTASDLTTRSSDFMYDVIIVIDSPDLESLGEIYHNNTEFFYQTTIVNIDHNTANEHFGQINIVDFNTASTAEIVLRLLKNLHINDITPDIATSLYTGLSAATKSFKSASVTPETLSHAAELIGLGARREEIVTHLYRTKTLPMLRLWGRALARLKSDSSRHLVWLLLQPEDFVKSGADEKDLPGVIDELVTTTPEAGVIVLFYEKKAGETCLIVQTGPGRNALDLIKPFNPFGDRFIAQACLRDKTLLEAEKIVIEYLRQLLPQSLNR
ncbi:MAG: DHH family phosphoesterase [Patescibacteria group bacterium]